MHRSRINGLLIDCKTEDVDAAARFWAEALGRPVDPNHPGTRGNYRMLETPPGALSVQIQRVDHESRVHIDARTWWSPGCLPTCSTSSTSKASVTKWVLRRARGAPTPVRENESADPTTRCQYEAGCSASSNAVT